MVNCKVYIIQLIVCSYFKLIITNCNLIYKLYTFNSFHKVSLVKAMVFPVVMYGCESGTIQKAECRRSDAFELWCWGRLLRVPRTVRSPTSPSLRRSVLSVHWKDWCWSWNSNTLATWCEELTHLKRPWCWERLKAGEEGDNRGFMVGWHHQLNGHEFG